jgi:hypothetical protein
MRLWSVSAVGWDRDWQLRPRIVRLPRYQCRLHRDVEPAAPDVFSYVCLPLSPPSLPVGCPRRELKRTPNRDGRPKDERHHIPVRNPGPTLFGRASNIEHQCRREL